MSAAPDGFPDIAEEVRSIIANQLRGGPALPDHTNEDTASRDELEPPSRRKGTLKSGKILTADTLVTRKITWPYEVVYNRHVQLAVYDDMSIALLKFCQCLPCSARRGMLQSEGVYAHSFTRANGRHGCVWLEMCEELPRGLAPADRRGQGHVG